MGHPQGHRARGGGFQGTLAAGDKEPLEPFRQEPRPRATLERSTLRGPVPCAVLSHARAFVEPVSKEEGGGAAQVNQLLGVSGLEIN